jgi:hypothetical protein
MTAALVLLDAQRVLTEQCDLYVLLHLSQLQRAGILSSERQHRDDELCAG